MSQSFGVVISVVGVMTIISCQQNSTSGAQGNEARTSPSASAASPAASVNDAKRSETPNKVNVQPPGVQKVSDAEIETRIKPLLKADEKLEHAVFSGPFGPEKGATLVLTSSSKDGPKRLFGFVLVGADNKRIDLPDLSDNQYVDRVDAVAPIDIDGDRALEIIIISTIFSGAGPSAGQEYPHNLILDWDDTKFVRLPAKEQKIANAKTAGQAKDSLGLLVK